MTQNPNVYRLLPTFLFEKKYADAREVIRRLYDEAFRESIILGIYENGAFCGLAEFYGFRDPAHKISIGYRLPERLWGRDEEETLYRNSLHRRPQAHTMTDIEIITASTLPENTASANVLLKNGFDLVVSGSDEDWGYERPLPTDKWIR